MDSNGLAFDSTGLASDSTGLSLTAISRLPAAFFFSVLYLSLMKVFHTLTRTFPNGTVSTWKFGQLHNGQFVAKGLESGTKRFFKSQAHMDARIRWMMWSCGYQKPSTQLVRQLALAI